jgi:mRNA interferase RelE/StbE
MLGVHLRSADRDPHRVGKPLNEPLAPQYSARRGEYRVLYLIDDDKIVIVVTAVSHRADAYRSGI